MRTVLVIDSSPNLSTSVSRALTRRFSESWSLSHPGDRIVHRDIGASPPPHLDSDTLAAWSTPPEKRDADGVRRAALSDALIAELVDADVVVIGAPMHNFSVSSGLKTWIDHVARAGMTFRYTEAGPQGLIADKPVYLVSSRGGAYGVGSGGEAADFQETQLLHVLRFLGLTDVTVIRAEKLAFGPDVARASVEAAERLVDEIVADSAASRAA
ncbi:NAD(P)H-dependent oxidoreductase [Iodidimonas sp. SYSU 1G8]|uniref:FMN-dependent NADH-azoreductase n=1 Tax=Iodidimonas sp. SYSU 1G8 TaxID=3133967 RepID=UPI0031FF01CA